jgi:hypothetical protein
MASGPVREMRLRDVALFPAAEPSSALQKLVDDAWEILISGLPSGPR